MNDDSMTTPAEPGTGSARRWPTVAVVVGVLTVVFYLYSPDDANSEPRGSGDTGDAGTAEVMCERFVKQDLRSPGSAEFDWQNYRTSGSGPRFTVHGSVDSQNAFGGLVRNDFTCTIRHTGGAQWRLIQMRGLTN